MNNKKYLEYLLVVWLEAIPYWGDRKALLLQAYDIKSIASTFMGLLICTFYTCIFYKFNSAYEIIERYKIITKEHFKEME